MAVKYLQQCTPTHPHIHSLILTDSPDSHLYTRQQSPISHLRSGLRFTVILFSLFDIWDYYISKVCTWIIYISQNQNIHMQPDTGVTYR